MCKNYTGYNGGGRIHKTWWRQTAPRSQQRDTIENILAANRARRQESVSGSERRVSGRMRFVSRG